MNNPQLNKNGELQHLLSTEGLPAPILRGILDRASSFVNVAAGKPSVESRCCNSPFLFNCGLFMQSAPLMVRRNTLAEFAAPRPDQAAASA